MLGYLYEMGTEVPKDSKRALTWYSRADDLGNVDSMSALGRIYLVGEIAPKDENKAFIWYNKASEAGSGEGARVAGVLTENGQGTTKDQAKANDLFRRAAERGDAEAMRFLGMNYEKGLGFPRDQRLALAWFKKSREAGSESAASDEQRLSAIVAQKDAPPRFSDRQCAKIFEVVKSQIKRVGAEHLSEKFRISLRDFVKPDKDANCRGPIPIITSTAADSETLTKMEADLLASDEPISLFSSGAVGKSTNEEAAWDGDISHDAAAIFLVAGVNEALYRRLRREYPFSEILDSAKAAVELEWTQRPDRLEALVHAGKEYRADVLKIDRLLDGRKKRRGQ